MDKEKLRRRLRTVFLNEFDAHLDTLQRGLQSLDAAPEAVEGELVDTLHRTAHSLKGSSRSAGVPILQRAGYALERIFAKVRAERQPPDPQIFRLLFTATDALEDARQQLPAQWDLTGRPIEKLLPHLEAAAEGNHHPAPPERADVPGGSFPG